MKKGGTVPEVDRAVLESLFGLIVHDLRNPTATLGANLSFVKEVLDDESVPPEEVQEALTDAQQALGDLMRGLEQLSWMGRWFNDNIIPSQGVYDLRRVFESARRRIKFGAVTFEAPDDECLIRGGDALERLIEVLVANGHQHAPQKTVHVRAVPQDDGLLIEIEDEGRPLREDLQPEAFSLEGQLGLKGVAAGRYGRVAGLFVASILAQAAGAKLDAVSRDGKNVFRVSTAKV